MRHPAPVWWMAAMACVLPGCLDALRAYPNVLPRCLDALRAKPNVLPSYLTLMTAGVPAPMSGSTCQGCKACQCGTSQGLQSSPPLLLHAPSCEPSPAHTLWCRLAPEKAAVADPLMILPH